MIHNPRTRITILLGVFVVLVVIFGVLYRPFRAATDQVASTPTNPVVKPTPVPGQFLVSYNHANKVNKDRAEAAYTALSLHKDLKQPHPELEKIGIDVVTTDVSADQDNDSTLTSLKARINGTVEQDMKVAPDFMPNDPYYPSQWAEPKISAPTAWDNNKGSGQIIAILDTGVDSTHPDLKANILPGWNFYDNNSDSSDVYGHGTGVAGTAAAVINNSLGVAGVAGEAKIMPLRISDINGYGYGSTISSALVYAADHGARAANISYAMTWSSAITTAAQYFQSKGGVVAMSIGNSGTFDSTPENPAILTIGATDSTDALASWSTTGNDVDLVGPGVSIYTTNRGGGYGSWSGTSFSAPIVAAVSALVINANPSLTAAQIQDILNKSADDKGTTGWDTSFGWGRVNAAKAISLATGGTTTTDTTPPTVSITSPVINATVSGTVIVTATATDNVAVNRVEFYLDGSLTSTVTSGAYSWSWNSLTTPNGSHSLTSKAYDSSGNATTSSVVTVTVSNTADTTVPTAVITAPADGSTISRTVTVTGTYQDNIGVVRVELYVDNVLKATSATAPFTVKWNTTKATKGNHTLQTKAFDAAGNVGLSQIVTVTK